jgi:membrane protein implicated in regulation of membrane protease activity
MAWWGWAILGIACMVIEVHLTQDFTLFCVGVAAFVVTAVAAFAVDLPYWSHWLLFSALSVVVLLTVRKPLLGRLRPDRGRDADFDYLLGEVATPSEDLAGNGVGKAELRGSVWTVRNAEPTNLNKGQRCRVTRIEGLTLWIKAE